MKGMQTEIPADLEGNLNAKTVVVLMDFEKRGHSVFESNPSDPDDIEALEQLNKISGEVGYILLHTYKGNISVLVGSKTTV